MKFNYFMIRIIHGKTFTINSELEAQPLLMLFNEVD